MKWNTNLIENWIGGKLVSATDESLFANLNPHNAELLQKVVTSGADKVDEAVSCAGKAQSAWSVFTPIKRSDILRELTLLMHGNRNELARILHLETGKSMKDAHGEVGAAIEQGFFWAGEGRRYSGRTLTTAAPNRSSFVVLAPIGVAGLIVPANTSLANIAWKIFPALLCGNAVVLKSAEDSPWIAWALAQITQIAGLPDGVLNVVHGDHETGKALVAHRNINAISFTGSTAAGRQIAKVAGERLAKVSLELGGKNPLVVCNDADINLALHWSLLSSFSNAGQRCAASSRIIVFDEIYNEFRNRFVENTQNLKLGVEDGDDLGPVINNHQLQFMLKAVQVAVNGGATLLIGGSRETGESHCKGYYMQPTILENVKPDAAISQTEIFGPVTCLYKVSDFNEALKIASDSEYGLTAAIHTQNLHRALEFAQSLPSGVVNVNGGTHGSEPHMPFGGVKNSGNGMREPGLEALDVYTEKKNIHLNFDPTKI
jgi:alpha-ketoglutaric semialdehyde dehydrogenase